MKRIIILLLIPLVLTGCIKNSAYGTEFKNEYEKVNGLENKMGKKHRVLNINKNNPYQKVEPNVILEKINNKETFYLYIGDPLCPWCRSVLESSINVANELKVKKIYYLDFWDDEGNEIFRDKYEILNGELIKTKEGTKAYNKILEISSDLLREYTLEDENGKTINIGENLRSNIFIYKKWKDSKIYGRCIRQTKRF